MEVDHRSSRIKGALYAQIVMRKGMSFKLKIHNKTEKASINELEQDSGKSFSSFKDMIDDLDNDDV